VVPGKPANRRHRSIPGRSFLLALILAATCVTCRRDAPNKTEDRVERTATPPSPATLSKPPVSVEPTSIEDFYGKLRLATLRGDRSYVANQLRYPINISSSTEKSFAIKDASEFLSRYPEIMVEALVQSISDRTTTEPSMGPVRIGTTESSYLTIFHVCENAPGELCRAGPIRVVAIHLGPRRPTESAPDPICERLFGGLRFVECSAVPRTHDYPDCRTVNVSSPDRRCPLSRVVLDITGYPGIAKVIQVSAVPASGPLRRVMLFSNAHSSKKASERAGVLMATLDFEKEQAATMLVGPGLSAYTKRRSINEASEDDQSAQRPDAGPIPIGNEQLLRGL